MALHRASSFHGCSLSPLGLNPRIRTLGATIRLPITCRFLFQCHHKLILPAQTSFLRRNFDLLDTIAMFLTQKRLSHQNHSTQSSPIHNHTTSQNKVFLTATTKQDAGAKITRLGLYSNLGIAIAKGIGGYAFNSQAMIADAWHSLTDMASDVLTLATVSCSKMPPTGYFPTGFGKIESLGALGVSSMLLIGGCFMCYHSCEILYAQFFLHSAIENVTHFHSHSHGSSTIPSIHAAWLALGTIFLKEWLYHATMRVAKRQKSSVLASNATHHRVDSLTGFVTFFAILGANFLREATWLDPVGGFIISLLVIKGGCGNTMSALYELADKSVEEEVKTSIKQNVKSTLEEIRYGSYVELQDIEGLKSGQNYLIRLQLAVPPTWSVQTMAVIEKELRESIGSKIRGVRRVQIRFVSKDNKSNSFHDEFITRGVNQQLENQIKQSNS
ncbi:Mitochondrial metal transporter 2 [Erysiphe necator]|nr:Mitochondrial metal transporter 2 [Erysiphe necator]